jgi:hypothetical protein
MTKIVKRSVTDPDPEAVIKLPPGAVITNYGSSSAIATTNSASVFTMLMRIQGFDDIRDITKITSKQFPKIHTGSGSSIRKNSGSALNQCGIRNPAGKVVFVLPI